MRRTFTAVIGLGFLVLLDAVGIGHVPGRQRQDRLPRRHPDPRDRSRWVRAHAADVR